MWGTRELCKDICSIRVQISAQYARPALKVYPAPKVYPVWFFCCEKSVLRNKRIKKILTLALTVIFKHIKNKK